MDVTNNEATEQLRIQLEGYRDHKGGASWSVAGVACRFIVYPATTNTVNPSAGHR